MFDRSPELHFTMKIGNLLHCTTFCCHVFFWGVTLQRNFVTLGEGYVKELEGGMELFFILRVCKRAEKKLLKDDLCLLQFLNK